MSVESDSGITSPGRENHRDFPWFLVFVHTRLRAGFPAAWEIFAAYDRRMERHACAQLPGITHILPAFLRGLTSRLKARKKGLLQGTKQEGNDCNYYKDYHQDLCYFHRKPGDPFRTQDVEH
jgi:hypothetical protein